MCIIADGTVPEVGPTAALPVDIWDVVLLDVSPTVCVVLALASDLVALSAAAVAVGVDAAVSSAFEEGSGIRRSFIDIEWAVGTEPATGVVESLSLVESSADADTAVVVVTIDAPVFGLLCCLGCSLSDGERERLRLPSAGTSGIARYTQYKR